VSCLGGAPMLSVAHSRSPAAHSRSLMALRPSSIVRATSLAMVDLWAELERCRTGEDGCITIKRPWERRRNLDGDFGAVDTTPVREAARTPTSPVGSGGGCMARASHLHMVVLPCNFRPHPLEKYDRSVNHAEFLQIYSTLILAAGGNEVVMANYFSMALTGMARS
jgi:hypothetical protein